jgi:hypothetical protein
MPGRVPWVDTAVDVSGEEGAALLASFKHYYVTKSNPMACTVCARYSDHQMRYRLLICKSSICRAASSSPCGWRGKALVCLETERTSVFEYGAHHAQASSPQRARLTPPQKEYCRELTGERVRPMRIHHALSRKFQTPLEELPNLTCVQNYVNNYARTSLDNHDLFDELSAWTADRGFTGSEPDTQPFSFTWALDPLGKPVIGDGSDESPFIVGLTTKALIKRLLMPPESFVLHIDGTYKLNTLDYPVLVIGVSDRARHFHLVAMFVVSQQVEPVLDAVLQSLRRLFGWVTGRELVVRYAMGDADQAQYNALVNAFGSNPHFQFLMCFFHVMENVEKHMKSLSSDDKASVVHDIYDLHFASDVETFSALRDEIIQRWWSKPELMRFAQYMCGQWLYGRFSNWQAFWTECGYASTNNLVETFNQVLKRDYTLRRRLKMGTLLNELSSCCRHRSSSRQGFISMPEASASLVRRASELVREQLLQQWGEVQTMETAHGPQVVVHVLAAALKRITITPTRRSEEGIAVSAQMGANYARMEVEGQPMTGWPVNLTVRWCPCK